jgi:hypothetical protein
MALTSLLVSEFAPTPLTLVDDDVANLCPSKSLFLFDCSPIVTKAFSKILLQVLLALFLWPDLEDSLGSDSDTFSETIITLSLMMAIREMNVHAHRE